MAAPSATSMSSSYLGSFIQNTCLSTFIQTTFLAPSSTQTTDVKSLQQQDKIQKQELEKRNKITEIYGSHFCSIIAKETLCNLPEVSANELNLENYFGKYPQGKVKPSMLKNNSAVRGICGDGRPFIAIKTEITYLTVKKTAIVVEVIFKRYQDDPNGTNYVSALTNVTEDGIEYNSFLCGTGGMRDFELQAVKDLLEGKTIEIPVRHPAPCPTAFATLKMV